MLAGMFLVGSYSFVCFASGEYVRRMTGLFRVCEQRRNMVLNQLWETIPWETIRPRRSSGGIRYATTGALRCVFL